MLGFKASDWIVGTLVVLIILASVAAVGTALL
jgi:hypothetical protein